MDTEDNTYGLQEDNTFQVFSFFNSNYIFSSFF